MLKSTNYRWVFAVNCCLYLRRLVTMHVTCTQSSLTTTSKQRRRRHRVNVAVVAWVRSPNIWAAGVQHIDGVFDTPSMCWTPNNSYTVTRTVFVNVTDCLLTHKTSVPSNALIFLQMHQNALVAGLRDPLAELIMSNVKKKHINSRCRLSRVRIGGAGSRRKC